MRRTLVILVLSLLVPIVLYFSDRSPFLRSLVYFVGQRYVHNGGSRHIDPQRV
jgi:hypothetical protein